VDIARDRQWHRGARPDDFLDELWRWLDLKMLIGWIPDLSAEPPVELSRVRQAEKLARLLRDDIRSPVGEGGV
jgi:hypothetical protein